MSRALRIGRVLWPVPVFLAVVLTAQSIWIGRYNVEGHAAGHLGSATTIFAGTFMIAVIVWAIPAGRRRDLLTGACAVLLLAGQLLVLFGNVQVVDAIAGNNWTDEQADALGASAPGFEAGHSLAGRGAWLAVGASILLAVVLARRRVVSSRVAIGAAAVSVVVPYFIAPGAGIVVLAVSLCVEKVRAIDRSADGRPS